MEGVLLFWAANPFWVWLAIAALILAVEVSTGTGWLLWAAGSAALTAVIMLLLPANPAVQLGVFAVLTVVSTLAGRRFLPKRWENEPDINDNVGRLVGKEGVAVTGFINGEGRVFIDGKEWAAVTETGAPLPLLDQKIEVTEAKGSILRVKAA